MTLQARLLKGAKVLGRFWRDGKTCASCWAPQCDCPDGTKTDFCGAKMLWTELAWRAGRDLSDGPDPYEILEVMTSQEVHATGLIMVIEHPDHGSVRVGPVGDVTMLDLARLINAPEGLDGFLKLLKVFPTAAVVRSGPREVKP